MFESAFFIKYRVLAAETTYSNARLALLFGTARRVKAVHSVRWERMDAETESPADCRSFQRAEPNFVPFSGPGLQL